MTTIIYVKEDKLIKFTNLEAFDSFLNGFSAQGVVSRLSVRLPFCVDHHVCPAHLGLPPLYPSLTFDRDTDVESKNKKNNNTKSAKSENK